MRKNVRGKGEKKEIWSIDGVFLLVSINRKNKDIGVYMSSNNLKIISEDNNIKDFWHNSMKNIVIGFMMTTITLNFLGLQYILPTIGAALLYVGFRDLRSENKSLKVA